ncbi:hypothetical protein AA0117_g5276 [Alternaria alternata]|uniref:Uncharacterized protein n=1 Tax=Alternaria alternata TaxID=5599 RepID=A0A4V1WS13_ALTAL|nr:hypothetical protein AA0117_g5276 [Alternaria alternata]
MSTSQPPKCYLLRIPRELRDAIYAYYLSDDGYYHQPESNTLRHADRSAIDLALTLSCKQVAAEMIALPLKLNAVEFRTHLAPIETAGIGERKWLFRKPPPRDRHNDDYSAPPSRAGHFHFLLARLHDKEADACVLRNSQNVSPNDSPKAAWASSFINYYQIRSQKLLTMK